MQVSVYSDQAACVCRRHKYNNICKHSRAVAALQSFVAAHLDFIRKKSRKYRNTTALAEQDIQKEAKTGTPIDQQGVWLNHTQVIPRKQPARHCTPMIHHNENLFELMSSRKVQPRASHGIWTFASERRSFLLMNPNKGDWSNCNPSRRETIRYHNAVKKWLTSLFPYFALEYILIPRDVKESLFDSHKKNLLYP